MDRQRHDGARRPDDRFGRQPLLRVDALPQPQWHHQLARAGDGVPVFAARLGLDPAKDYQTFDRLGNVGSVSVPATLALGLAEGRIKPGERVALLGIGSGLASMMLAVEHALVDFERDLDAGRIASLDAASSRVGRLVGESVVVQSIIYASMKRAEASPSAVDTSPAAD